MNLADYCKEHAGRPENDELHEGLVVAVLDGLPRYGINVPVECYREVGLVKDGVTVGRPDLILISDTETYLVEARVFRNHKGKSKPAGLSRQLNIGRKFLKEIFGIDPVLKGIYRHERDEFISYFDLVFNEEKNGKPYYKRPSR